MKQKQGDSLLKQLEEWVRLNGQDPVLEHMIRKQLPLTRENYLALRFWEGYELDGELEATIPPLP